MDTCHPDGGGRLPRREGIWERPPTFGQVFSVRSCLDARKKIMEAVRAIEMHMMLSCIAMGILQSLSLNLFSEDKVPYGKLRYLRTPSKGRVSETTLMYYLRKYIFHIIEKSPELRITRIIQEKQDKSEIHWDSLAS